MNPFGYQAPVLKASRCGNERQERSGRGKQVAGEVVKKSLASPASLSRNFTMNFIEGTQTWIMYANLADAVKNFSCLGDT